MADPTPTPLTDAEREAIVGRLSAAEEAWLWHEATDDTIAGHGWHMSQMLARLPWDSQTADMETSVHNLVVDLRAALGDADAREAAARADERERWEDERDHLLAPFAALAEEYETTTNPAPYTSERALWERFSSALAAALTARGDRG